MHSNSKCLISYKSGIIKEEDCTCSNPDKQVVNHAVTIVGYGKSNGERLDCNEYWLIKNSWGPDWGLGGFFKLCADKSEKTGVVGTC